MSQVDIVLSLVVATVFGAALYSIGRTILELLGVDTWFALLIGIITFILAFELYLRHLKNVGDK